MKEEQEEWDEWGKTTKGKGRREEALKGRLMFRMEGTKGFIERLALWSDVVNSKDQRKAIFEKSG